LTSHSFATRFTKRCFCSGSKLSNIMEGPGDMSGRCCVTCLGEGDDGWLFPTADVRLRGGGGKVKQATLCASQT
jgi:hypothetical protein